MIDNKFTDDQLSLGVYINEHPELVRVDSDAILLHTTTFGVNAGTQRIFVQSKDAPTLAELYGRGAFFIHIPGCVNKGQKCVYNDVCNILSMGLSDKTLRMEYDYEEPPWNGFVFKD
jgi:hypothetical protein